MSLNRIVLILVMVSLMLATGCGGGEEAVEPDADAVSPGADVADAVSEPVSEEPDPADVILGHWYSENDDAQIVVSKEDGVIGGKIIWLKSPNYDEEGDEELGQPRRDRNNPDEDLQTRPIVGLDMIHGFTYDEGEEHWSGGSIYDPESGKTYKCQITLGENDTLNVRGYIGIPTLGRTTVWRRVPEGKEKSEAAATPSA